MIKVFNRNVIKELYSQGLSAQEIKDTLHLPITIRQIQRIVKEFGISRNAKESFNNAIKRGRVKFHFREYWLNHKKIKRIHLSSKLRYAVLKRDNFTCKSCGISAKYSPLEVDHIDQDKNNNIINNLQTLCHLCNIGKDRLYRFT